MCFFPLNLLPTVFPPSKLLGLMVNASHPNVLYSSLNVLIVPLPLLPLMFFGFLIYQPIALSSTSNTQIFLFLPSNLLPLLHLVGKISMLFFSNNLLLLFLLKIFMIFSIRTNHSSSHTPLAFSPASVSFSHFSPITFTDLITIIKSVSSSSCSLDLIPLKILNDLSSFFYLIILNLINLSLATSKFSTSFKSFIVTPILKKPFLDPSIISNYHPISNLSFFFKFLKKLLTSNFQTFFFLTIFFPLPNLVFDPPTLLKLAF